MVIKVLGTGCTNCQKLKTLAAEVITELGLDAQVVEVKEMGEILGYGVTSTPGLVIDDKLVGYGGVPDKAQLVSLILSTVSIA